MKGTKGNRMKAVIDTNILVSALWKKSGNAYFILSNVVVGKITPCYDFRMMKEYRDVLARPKFKFPHVEVYDIFKILTRNGICVTPVPLPSADVKDNDDRAFYETAKFCNAPLITGNLKHFPPDSLVMSPADFCSLYLRG